MIRCTATTRHHDNPNRCVRQIGHAGLHRVIVEKKVNEFSDSNANYPKTGFTKDEIAAIIKGDV
jgi:hypothetical protein